ncbi:unnamed protein product [Rhizopus stolonifer]
MSMMQENGDRCLAVLDQAELDVVYVEELGAKRPIIMGKEVIIRDTVVFAYDSYCYPFLIAGSQTAPTSSIIPSSPVLSCSKPTATALSSESSHAPTPGVFEGAATKQAVMNLLTAISCTTPPNMDLYQKFDNISNKTIRDVVAKFIPDAATVPMPIFSQWLNDHPSATRLTK